MQKQQISYTSPLDALVAVAKRLSLYENQHNMSSEDLLTKGIDENGNIRSEATHQFKDSAIGRIPVEWDVRKIGELSYIENGTTPSRENPIFWHEGTIPWLTTGQVHDRFIFQSNEFISEYALRLCSLKILPVGTILIAMIGQGLTRGKAAYLGFESSINQNFAAIIPNQLFNSRFLFHYLDFNYEYVRGASQGSNQQALNSSVVSNLKVV